jgi:hypothetical protein
MNHTPQNKQKEYIELDDILLLPKPFDDSQRPKWVPRDQHDATARLACIEEFYKKSIETNVYDVLATKNETEVTMYVKEFLNAKEHLEILESHREYWTMQGRIDNQTSNRIKNIVNFYRHMETKIGEIVSKRNLKIKGIASQSEDYNLNRENIGADVRPKWVPLDSNHTEGFLKTYEAMFDEELFKEDYIRKLNNPSLKMVTEDVEEIVCNLSVFNLNIRSWVAEGKVSDIQCNKVLILLNKFSSAKESIEKELEKRGLNPAQQI